MVLTRSIGRKSWDSKQLFNEETGIEASRRVLGGCAVVIADNKELRLSLGDELACCGLRSVEFEDVPSALDYLADRTRPSGTDTPHTGPVQVVIADVELPEHSVVELVGEVKSHSMALPLVLVNVVEGSELHCLVELLGADAILWKGQATSGVMTIVERLLSQPMAAGR